MVTECSIHVVHITRNTKHLAIDQNIFDLDLYRELLCCIFQVHS